MSPQSNTKKVAIFAAIAGVAAAAVAYIAINSNNEQSKTNSKDSDAESKKQALDILKNIKEIQIQTKKVLGDLSTKLITEPMSLIQIYEELKGTIPADPVQSHGMNMEQFDGLLTQYGDDADIKQLITSIMGQEGPDVDDPKVQAIQVDTLITIHKFMLEQLQSVVATVKALGDRSKYDPRVITMAAQALVGSKVKEEFDVDPNDVESSVLVNYIRLQYNQEFNQISVKMQAIMSEFITELGE